ADPPPDRLRRRALRARRRPHRGSHDRRALHPRGGVVGVDLAAGGLRHRARRRRRPPHPPGRTLGFRFRRSDAVAPLQYGGNRTIATGLISGAADDLLDELRTTYTYIQLHTDDPGAAGTSNVATEGDRVQVTWGAASSGSMSSASDLEWTNVAGSE